MDIPAVLANAPVSGKVEQNTYFIASALNKNFVLDVSAASMENNANVQLWFTVGSAKNQMWQISDTDGDGYYTIVSLNSGKALEAASGGTTDGTNVQQYERNGTDAQLWKLEENADGTYLIRNKNSGLALDLFTATLANGQNIQLYTPNNTAAQKWYLIPADVTGPEITNIEYSEISAEGFRVTCTVSDVSGIQKVEFPAWTKHNGQDDQKWHEAAVTGTTATCYISISDHNFEPGDYEVHIYTYDTLGNSHAIVAGETTDTQQDVYAGIVNCTFIGSVSVDAKDQEYAGGIVGMASATTVKNCFCAAAVSATEVGDHSIGSLCGVAINECTITNCWYDSTVSSLGEVNKEDHDGVTGLSTELLALGSAAHALGFGQTLGVDPYPSYGDDPVYQVTTGCCTYSNTKPSGVTQKSHAGGSCTGKAICADCGVLYGENLGHSYVGGKCTNCDDTKPVSISGTFNDWGHTDMVWTESGYTYSMELPAGTYEFKLVKDGAWLGNNGIIVDTTTTTSAVGWEFVDANNCQLVATGGTYYFTFNFDTSMLVITYNHTHSHTAGKVVAPTCTAAGYTVYTCACGDSYNGDEVAKLGHSYKTVVTKPTCTTAGKSTHTCSTCNDSYVTDVVAALGHTWLNANCTTPKTCSVCGATEGKALGHTWVAATCTTVKTCSVCGATEGGTLDHRYNVVVTAPTCTAAGYSTYTCSGCGDSYHGDEVAALGHSYENGTCIRCGAVDLDYVQRPNLTLQYPTLTFEDVITMNVFFQASNLEDVVEMGLITYKSQVTDYGVDTAETVIPGYHEASGLYFASTAGIPAKEMGDTYWFAVYAKLSDGSYVYTRLVSYSPTQYAYGQLSDPEMSKLVVAMLNYGAAAQTYFNYRTDDLMNKNLTDAQQASIETYRADMMDPVVNVDSSKVSIFTNNGGFSRRYPTITFEGAFCIDYYFTPAHTSSGNVSMYYWTQDAYEAADILSPFNASGCLIMVPDGTGAYKATIEGIAAKDLDKTIYVASGYNSGRSVYCSGVLAYSIGAYCVSQAATTDAMAPFAQATAVYGYYAKELFY